MKIRNRMSNIKALQTHALQDYFEMEISAHNCMWRDELVQVLNNKTAYRQNYSCALEKMCADPTLNNYSIKDMDTTLMAALLLHDKPFCTYLNDRIKSCLNLLLNDKNFDSHLNENEDEVDLFHWAEGYLQVIKEFVKAVSVKNKLDASIRQKYKTKYFYEIDAMYDEIEEDWEELYKFKALKDEIKKIAKSKRRHEDYHNIFFKLLRENDYDTLRWFIINSAEMGIPEGINDAGDMYFEGDFGVKKNYSYAADYFAQVTEDLNYHDKIKWANLIINGYCNNYSTEDGFDILNTMKKDIDEIRSEIQDDGFVWHDFYHDETPEEKKRRLMREKMKAVYYWKREKLAKEGTHWSSCSISEEDCREYEKAIQNNKNS